MAKVNAFRQVLILLYKGLLLRKRHYIITFFEVVFPILLACLLPILNSELSAPAHNEEPERRRAFMNASTFSPFSPYDTQSSSDYDLQFVYTPSNDVIDKFMLDAVERFKMNSKYQGNITVHNENSESDLESFFLYAQGRGFSVLQIGTVFNNFFPSLTQLPNSLDYKIRYGHPGYFNSFNTEQKYQVNGPHTYSKYKDSFFLGWQTAVEETFIEYKMKNSAIKFDYKVSMQQFPYPDSKDSAAKFSVINIVPWFIAYSFLSFIMNLVRRVIEEKSNGSKELMKMMGMTDGVYWISTFINYFIVGFIITLITAIVYKAPLKNSLVFLKYTDFFLLLIMLLLFATSVILFSMAFSVFFNSGVFAVITLLCIYIASFTLFMSNYFLDKTDINYFPLPLIAKFGICLFPSGGLLTMFLIVAFYESSGEGVHWYNLNEHAVSPDINMSLILSFVLFSCFLYALIIWYFDKVWPWQPGVPMPFYFLFTRSYWCGPKSKESDEIELVLNDIKSDFFEEDPTGVSPGVVIQNLSKEFRVGLHTKLAVNNVSLKMYQGQITALLGHNGAGKTTTINILTGLFTPTKGTASINGRDILTETVNARRGIGVCPQHNVLFETLTVEEHLKIFAALKGTEWLKLTSEASKIMETLKLSEKRNELSRNLSGGMKRKLSLGNAIVGGSKVLFLDEPTSGMDVEARRSVWDVLLEIRHDRTIILTTHYMEEADILGDRIAIMAEGEIQCSGSPMYLKRKFGTGYHLHVVKGPDFNCFETTELLKTHIPEIIVEKELENEITYNLLSNSGSVFGDMFEDLERNKANFGISSCGITITTMEDVFLNVSSISDLKYKLKNENDIQEEMLELEDVYGDSKELKKHNIVNQFVGLIAKRFHYAKRHWSILVAQIVLPFLILSLCQYLITDTQREAKITYEPLKLDIYAIYGATDGFYFAKEKDKLSDHFVNVLSENYVKAEKIDNPTEYVLEYGKNDMSRYLKSFMVGGSIDKFENGTTNLTAWFNGEPYHALPMSLLMMHTSVLRQITNEMPTITLTNAPLPVTNEYLYYDEQRMPERITASIFIPLALSFLSASFVLLPIHERVSKAKLLQLMTGLSSFMYWTTMFLWDFFIYFVICLILMIPFAIFSHYVFFSNHSEAIGTCLLLLILYGWASIPLSYLISFIFKKGNSGFSVIVAINVIISVIVHTIMSVMQLTAPPGTFPTIDALMWVFRAFPAFCLASSTSKLVAKAYSNAYCDGISHQDLQETCESHFMSPDKSLFKCCKNICGEACLVETPLINWDMDSCGRDILFLILDGFIFFALVLFFELRFSKTIMHYIKKLTSKMKKSVVGYILQPNGIEDSDVAAEEQRIHNMYATHGDSGSDALMVIDLTKMFSNFYAVDHLTFGIHQEECFGLLGVNGAGKTTTFRMLTGDCIPTEGNAFVHQSSLMADIKRFQSYLGYCPQFDALIDRLTGYETLCLFARLRGMSEPELSIRVNKLIKMIDLTPHADKQTRFYSGGNKRKLSVGMALIGAPPLILLDEPTAGVDPVSRRKIWNILAQARNFTKASIILTTHSMEESEALCNRLAIMVNGRFRCLGSIQQLKSKFGQGYTLIIKLRNEMIRDSATIQDIKQYIGSNLIGAELKDDHQGMLQYHVVNPSVTLGKLFKFMSEMKPKFDLEDYLISDTSLEQIFLTFARAQRVDHGN